MSQADLARATGIGRGLIGSYIHGQKGPGADNLFTLADSLAVSPRWLYLGVGEKTVAERLAPADDDWVQIPRLDLFKFQDGVVPAPIESVPIRRDWLAASARSSAALWLADMPSDAMPDIAREGDTIICRDPDRPLADGRVYVFLLEGRPIVRRVHVRPEGLMLKAGDPSIDPILLTPDRLDQLAPIGRVLAALSMHAV
jgi:transcriptional regulator with XRE-family HTH domain